ncbi:MAG: hypothetical protein ABIH00_11085 [Armatimonadota bacterium]
MSINETSKTQILSQIEWLKSTKEITDTETVKQRSLIAKDVLKNIGTASITAQELEKILGSKETCASLLSQAIEGMPQLNSLDNFFNTTNNDLIPKAIETDLTPKETETTEAVEETVESAISTTEEAAETEKKEETSTEMTEFEKTLAEKYNLPELTAEEKESLNAALSSMNLTGGMGGFNPMMSMMGMGGMFGMPGMGMLSMFGMPGASDQSAMNFFNPAEDTAFGSSFFSDEVSESADTGDMF